MISLQFVRSENNLADPFTKGLTKKVVLESSRGMGLKPLCWGKYGGYHQWSNETIWLLYCITFLISMTCGNTLWIGWTFSSCIALIIRWSIWIGLDELTACYFERWEFFALNESIASLVVLLRRTWWIQLRESEGGPPSMKELGFLSRALISIQGVRMAIKSAGL